MAGVTAKDLTRHVAFDGLALGGNGGGGLVSGWAAAGAATQARAHFRYLRGGETVQAGRLAGRQPVVVTIRDTPEARAITSDWRMRDLDSDPDPAKQVQYNVRTPPVPTDDRRFLEILVESGVPV